MGDNGKDMTEDKDTEDHSAEVGSGKVLAVRSNVVAVEVDGLDLLEVSSSPSDQRSLNNS